MYLSATKYESFKQYQVFLFISETPISCRLLDGTTSTECIDQILKSNPQFYVARQSHYSFSKRKEPCNYYKISFIALLYFLTNPTQQYLYVD